MLCARLRLRVSPQTFQRRGAAVMRDRKGRIELDGAIHACQCVIEPAEAHQSGGIGDVGFRQIGRERQRVAVTVDRILQPARIVQQRAAVEPVGAGIGVQRQRAVVGASSFWPSRS